MRATQTLFGWLVGGLVAQAALASSPPAPSQGPAEARMLLRESRPDELAPAAAPKANAYGIEWDARAAEHLLNRAGFGARRSEIDAFVARGLEASVGYLLNERVDSDPFFVQRYGPDYRAMRDMSEMERDKIKRQIKRDERQQMEDFRQWWFERLMSGDERLQERMTLFWHGFFTSSPQGVRRTFELLNQNMLVRKHALGNYADLLREMVRDPALLMYLDNHVNKKGKPNENFARELMELFSLGEGNYTEGDVKEAARAMTGRASNGDGHYVFRKGAHDRGRKTILGRTGRFDGDDLVDILLEQDACPRWVAYRFLTYMEGAEPGEERLNEYATLLRTKNFEMKPLLRKLFTDPHFYSDEVVAARVSSPVDYLVGTARRLGIEPPGQLLHLSSSALGEKLCFPPNVKGWEGGMAWVTTASLMQRGNFAGLMLGVVDVKDVVAEDDWDGDESMMDAKGMGDEDDSMMMGERAADSGKSKTKMPTELRAWSRVRGTWRSHLNLTSRLTKHGVQTDAEIVDLLLDELLAVDTTGDSRERMLDYLSHERRTLGTLEGKLLDGDPDHEKLLRRLAHLILSLPEAQLV